MKFEIYDFLRANINRRLYRAWPLRLWNARLIKSAERVVDYARETFQRASVFRVCRGKVTVVGVYRVRSVVANARKWARTDGY